MTKLLIVLYFLTMGTYAQGAIFFNATPTKGRITHRLMNGDTRALADEALDHMLREASFQLRRHGFRGEAEQLANEWTTTYHGRLTRHQDTGDHPDYVLSAWLNAWYMEIENALGVQVMETTHLRDIWVINWTLRIVLEPREASEWCSEELAMHPDDECRMEYRRHFAGTRWADAEDPYRRDMPHAIKH